MVVQKMNDWVGGEGVDVNVNAYMGGLFWVLWRELDAACNILSEKAMLQIRLVFDFKMSVNERIKGWSLDKNDSPFT